VLFVVNKKTERDTSSTQKSEEPKYLGLCNGNGDIVSFLAPDFKALTDLVSRSKEADVEIRDRPLTGLGRA
jgi:hypothetical protein